MRSFLIKAWRWLGGIRLTVVILLCCAPTPPSVICAWTGGPAFFSR
jgi:hypothetical protein